MDKTKIEWADASLNPVRARHRETGKIGWFCTHASPGCGDSTGGGCYAEAINRRLGTGIDYQAQNVSKVEMYLDEKILASPLRWARGRRIFWNSMSDTFGDFVPDTWIDRMFAVCALTPQHQHLFLTKRAERMRDYINAARAGDRDIEGRAFSIPLADHWRTATIIRNTIVSGFKNVWAGISVEDQRRYDERAVALRDTPAAVRWISYEPALGPVEMELNWAGHKIDWVVCGGESGPGARLFSIDWARSIIAQCREAGVPCFIKQLGAKPYWQEDATALLPLHDRKGGNPVEWPEDLRVREYPEPRDV